MPGTIIDMHLHTTRGASDSMLDPDDLIAEARRVGLTGVNITEHDRMWESWDLSPFRKKHEGIFVSNGMEVSTDMGHILAVGLKGYAGGIHEVWSLANEGRVDTIVVENGFRLPARIGGNHELLPADDPHHPEVNDDIVDDTIESVLLSGGNAVIVSDGALADVERVAAILRY